jgi:hypothetical protein
MKTKALFLFLLFISSSLFAQNFSNGFNFSLPDADTTTQKFLPVFPVVPIGDNDFVQINSDGKFSVNGKRIRFWGVNTGFEANFPNKEYAGLIAGRLRKSGCNLIRIVQFDAAGGTIGIYKDHAIYTTRQLDPTGLDLLENYIASLKESGIRVDIDLQTDRSYRPDDQVVDYDSILNYKAVGFIDPHIRQLSKEFTQQLLTHVNPYTGKALVDDPVMAMVEVSNENSLYMFWRCNQLRPICKGGMLPSRYSGMLDSLWIDFLKKKYSSTGNLRNAWNVGTSDNQIKNGGFEEGTSNWGLWLQAPANATFTRDNSNPFSGMYTGKVAITNSTGNNLDISFEQKTITFKKDSLYTVRFAARSDSTQYIHINVQDENDPWTWYGGGYVLVTHGWNQYAFHVKAPEDNTGHTKIGFHIGENTGTFWFDDMSLTGTNGLLVQESFELNNICRMDYPDCAYYTNQRVKDLSEFYISLEREYFQDMISFLKNTLGVRVPIIGTMYSVGPADLAAQSDGDYVDNHSYWDHPQFPHESWSQTDWIIQNKPMVKDDNGGLVSLGSAPMMGKPFMWSEYNHSFPNQYQVESILFSAGYSAFNDMDALMYYNYFVYIEGNKWEDEGDLISGWFSINRNSLFMSFFPTASFVFRNGLVKPSIDPITVEYSIDTLYSLPKQDAINYGSPSFEWYSPYFDDKISLTHAFKTSSYFSNSTTNFSSLPPAGTSPYITDTREINWNTTDGTITIETDKFIGAGGYLSNLKNKTSGALSVVNCPEFDFGVVTWLSLTDSSVSHTKRSLITLGSKIQNTGMIWNSDNTSVGDNWGTAPTQIYPLTLDLNLNIVADSIRVYPLNSTGREEMITPFVVKPVTKNHFNVELDQNVYKTLWFGIEKIEKEQPLNIVIDGIKDDFYNQLSSPYDGYLQLKSYTFNDNGIPAGDPDLSAKVWTAWDKDWFYLYEEVLDDTLSGNAPDVWDEDCIELKFDPLPADSVMSSVWETRLTALGMATGVIAADNLNNLDDTQKKWARRVIPGGYALELAIKWPAIQSGSETITPANESVFGLAINQHDNDGIGHQASVQWAAVLSDAVWNTPKYYGRVKLLPDHKIQFIAGNNMTGKTNPVPYDGTSFYMRIDGKKDPFYHSLTGPDNGYLQIRSFAHNENGQPVNDDDLSAKIWTAWDNQKLYLYEEVKDDSLSGNAPNVWDEDEIELKFDPQPTDSITNSIWGTSLTALGKESAGVVADDSLNSVPHSQKQWARTRIPGGYALEFAINWEAISYGSETITPSAGSLFGLAINQHDNDGNVRKATIQWAAVLNNAVYNTPKYLGTVKLLSNNKLQYIPTNNMTGAMNPIPYDGSDLLSAPDKPVLSSPANGSTNQALNPVLSWNTANRAASYTLQVSSVSNFSSTVVNQSGITSTSRSLSGLSTTTKYYWRVQAANGSGTSSWSDTWNFTTVQAAPDTPTLSSPANNSTSQAVSLTLRWNAAGRADNYALQVSTSSGFSSTFLNKSGIASTSQIVSGLKNKTKYYWRVNATSAGGTSNWSNTWNFTTKSNVGIDETGENPDYFIYPNPTDGIITIESTVPNCLLTIFSVDGKPIVKNAMYEGVNSFDLTDLTSGIYILKLENSSNVIIRKLIKK